MLVLCFHIVIGSGCLALCWPTHTWAEIWRTLEPEFDSMEIARRPRGDSWTRAGWSLYLVRIKVVFCSCIRPGSERLRIWGQCFQQLNQRGSPILFSPHIRAMARRGQGTLKNSRWFRSLTGCGKNSFLMSFYHTCNDSETQWVIGPSKLSSRCNMIMQRQSSSPT